MAIDYHKTAWECPECKLWHGVSRCKTGSAIRKCGGRGGCGTEVMVTVKNFSFQTTDYENRITSQPVRAE